MSRDGQCPEWNDESGAAVAVVTFPMPAGSVFDWHTHPDHQLAWAASGVLTVRSETRAWVLPPTRALWIPAGIRHETLSESTTTMRTAYVHPALCGITWDECTPVEATTLMAELIGLLEDRTIDATRRANAERLLVDLLEPVSSTSIQVRMPVDARARQVAQAILEDPTDGRTLSAWGDVVGASDRTLARAFLADTGVPFGRWRSLARLRSSIEALAAGAPVSNVARKVGYESTSAFVAAFRKETGMTPRGYFRSSQGR